MQLFKNKEPDPHLWTKNHVHILLSAERQIAEELSIDIMLKNQCNAFKNLTEMDVDIVLNISNM